MSQKRIVMPPTPKHTRRWFQFSLGTMLLLVTVFAIGLYWPWRVRQLTLARMSFEEARAMYETDTIGTEDICESSTRLYRAEIAVPFANHERAAAEHFDRVESIWNRAYGPASEWLMGVANDEDLKEAKARMEKVETYYKDAARVAGVELPPPPE